MKDYLNQRQAQERDNDRLLGIDPAAALELQRLGLAVLIDVRQKFELELEGEIHGARSLPLFQFKRTLGHRLTPEEQEILDEDVPEPADVQYFLALINDLHYIKDYILLCVCNSGKRSLKAAQLLRGIGYPRSFSVTGGCRALRNMRDLGSE